MINRILLSIVALVSSVSLTTSLSAQDVGLQVEEGMRVLFGADTVGAGDKLMFLPDLHAFRVGTVAPGFASTFWDPDSIGLYSFASGFNNRAQGMGATAMGRDCEASKDYAFAAGLFCDADGQYSTALGFTTNAKGTGSVALGYKSDANSFYSFGAGYNAKADAIYSVAIGNYVSSQSYSSMAVGRYNVGGGSAGSWIATDPIFEIGIGSSLSDSANAVTVLKNGNVGIGIINPSSALHVDGLIRSNQIETKGHIRPSTNNVYDLGSSTFRWDDVYATNGTINTSDRRDKENITPISYGLDEILELRPVSFTWKHNPIQGVKLGLIAQELNQIIGEVVKTHELVQTEEGSEATELVEMERMGVYYSDLIPVLIKAIQEQEEGIAEKEARIEMLEADVAELKDLTKSLIAKINL